MTHKTVRGWLGMLSALIFTVILVISGGALADPPIPGGDDCGLELSAPISAVDIGGAVKATGVRDDVLDCYITSLLAAGVAPADIAEGLLTAGYAVFDVVRAIVVIGGADVVTDVIARVNTVLGPTVSQTVRDAVAEAVRVRAGGGGRAIGDPDARGCELEVSEPISAEGISIAVKAAGVRDDLLECYVVFLLQAGVAPADIAEGLLRAGYLVSDVVRTVVMVSGVDVADEVVARANTVYCRMLTKGSACGSAVAVAVADAALAGATAATGLADTDSMAEFMRLVAAGEIAAGAKQLQPGDDAGGMRDASLQ